MLPRWLRRRRSVPLSPIDRAGVMFLLTDVRGTVETATKVLDDEPSNPRAAYLRGVLAGLVDRLDRFEGRFYEETEEGGSG